MLNKKIEIKLGGVEIPLWFNNYASFELQKMYGSEPDKVMIVLKERLQESYLLVFSDLVKCAIKGHYLAKELSKPDYFENISEMIADENPASLLKSWGEIWECFANSMGLNLPKPEETGKKKATRNTKKVKS